MTARYVRAHYRVPARRGGRVVVDGTPGVITGFDQQYLSVRLAGTRRSVPVHPTWRVTYLTTGGNHPYTCEGDQLATGPPRNP
jgi:hypothetical protein